MRFIFVDHKRDAARAEDALTLSFGSELIGMQRDWNEELQSCREFPHTTPQERYCYLFAKRPALYLFLSIYNMFLWSILNKAIWCRILRDRALYKVTSDFVDAAISGAVGVISRCIPPINPTDPECFHMLVVRKKFLAECDTSRNVFLFIILLFKCNNIWNTSLYCSRC